MFDVEVWWERNVMVSMYVWTFVAPISGELSIGTGVNSSFLLNGSMCTFLSVLACRLADVMACTFSPFRRKCDPE